jgi:ATP-dependent Lhr-like helicase
MLDQKAIERVHDEARPDPRDADELHDVLLTTGFLTAEDAAAISRELFDQLTVARRATIAGGLWVAAERLPELLAVHADARLEPPIAAPPSRAARAWTREEAIVELLKGRITIVGPTTVSALAASLSIADGEAEAALLALESEGIVLRGSFTSRTRQSAPEWCERRLLARIHRYTLNRLRAEIEPVSPADFMRFLFTWQHVDPSAHLTGIDGLRTIIGVLDGFELAASAWERSVLPARMDNYNSTLLDTLCLTGEVGWARLSSGARSSDDEPTDVVGTTPIALFLREHANVWTGLAQAARRDARPEPTEGRAGSDDCASKVLDALRQRGASFFHELASACRADDAALCTAIADLVAAGLVTSDGFGGIRSIVQNGAARPRPDTSPGTRSQSAGRWSAIASTEIDRDALVEHQARALLRRYGVVFRRLLTREANAAPWRELARVYRRLEARGEIRGGRFVTGMSGEQFALPDAIDRLRETRRSARNGRCLAIGAADPLNLAGIVTSGERVRVVAANRLVYRDGVPMAVLEGEFMRPLADFTAAAAADVTSALAGRPMPPVLGGYIGAISH